MTQRDECAVAVRTVDIAQRVDPIVDVSGYSLTRVFVTDGGVLLGSVDVANARQPISATRLRDAVANGLSYTLMKRALEKQLGLDRTADLPLDVSVSIVIPTCNRADDLRRCLQALRHVRTPRRCEIVVIDNRPGPASPTPAVVRDFPDVRLIEEHRPGLSYARNAGFAAATGDILIAIDDDVVVSDGWLERLVAPFARPEGDGRHRPRAAARTRDAIAMRVRGLRRPRQGLQRLRGGRRMVPCDEGRGADVESRCDRQRRVSRGDLRRSAHRHARRGARRRHTHRLQRGYLSLLSHSQGGRHDRLRPGRVRLASPPP
jgi:hypothetical protein